MATITRQEFTGQEGLHNNGLDLVALNGRIYFASGSRILSPDPYIQDPTNTQSYDRYSYVMNNPLSANDPSGFCGISIQSTFTPGGRFDTSEGSLGVGATSGYWTFTYIDSPCEPPLPPAFHGGHGSDGSNGGNSSGQTPLRDLPQQEIPCLPGVSCYLRQLSPNCGSALPNGSTIESNVERVNSDVDQTELSTAQAGGDPFAAGLGTYLGSVGSYGPLDFKNNFRGQGDPGFLGEAGNFAFGSVSAHLFGSGSFGQYIALSSGGVYASLAGKKGPGIPFLVAPYGADPSAQANIPAGVASSCPVPAR